MLPLILESKFLGVESKFLNILSTVASFVKNVSVEPCSVVTVTVYLQGYKRCSVTGFNCGYVNFISN